jgi:hypothetical protein
MKLEFKPCPVCGAVERRIGFVFRIDHDYEKHGMPPRKSCDLSAHDSSIKRERERLPSPDLSGLVGQPIQ